MRLQFIEKIHILPHKVVSNIDSDDFLVEYMLETNGMKPHTLGENSARWLSRSECQMEAKIKAERLPNFQQ